MGLILGFVGNAGVGKSTLAQDCQNYLIKEYEEESKIIGFAKTLRDEIGSEAYYGRFDKSVIDTLDLVPHEVLLGFDEVKKDPNVLYIKPTSHNVRRLLQWWGTDFRRYNDPYYWVKRWAETKNPTGNTIVDDVRFRNEYDIIKACGGHCIRLISDKTLITVPKHESENIDSWWQPNMGITLRLKNKSSDRDLSNAYALFDLLKSVGWFK